MHLRLQRIARIFLIVASVVAMVTIAAAADKKQPPSRPINLNAATVKELQELPGVGSVTAKAIIQFRQKSGPLKRVEDLLAVRGISEAKLKKMRPYVMVTATTTPTHAATPAKP